MGTNLLVTPGGNRYRVNINMAKLILYSTIILRLAIGPANSAGISPDVPLGSMTILTPGPSGSAQPQPPVRPGSLPVLAQQDKSAPVLRTLTPSPVLLPQGQDPPLEIAALFLVDWTIEHITDVVLSPYSSRDPPQA